MTYVLVVVLEGDLDTTVLVATEPGLVVTDRLGVAMALGAETAGGDTLLHEVVDDGLGTLLGEFLVVGLGTDVVGVAVDLGSDLRVLVHPFDDAVETELGFLGDLEGVELEEGRVAEEFVDFVRLGVHIRTGHVDGVMHGVRLVDVLDGLAVHVDGLRLELAAEVEGEADGSAEVGGRADAAALGAFAGDGCVREDGVAQVRDDADHLAEVDREHDTETAGGSTLVNLHITGVHVRDEAAVHTDEDVAVDVHQFLLGKVDVLVAGGEALPAHAETGNVIEPLADVDVSSITCADVGILTVDELLTVPADVDTAADAGEPVVLDILSLLGESRQTGRQGEHRDNESLDFHILGSFRFRLFEVIDDTEGELADEVERETGVALVAALVAVRRPDAVVPVAISLEAEVGEEAEAGLEVNLCDETGAETGHEVGIVRVLERVVRVGESKGLGRADTGIETRSEGPVGLSQSVHVQEGIGEAVDALVGERPDILAASLHDVGTAGVLGVTAREPDTEGAGEIIADGCCALELDEVLEHAVVGVTENVVADRDRCAALDGDVPPSSVIKGRLGKKGGHPREEYRQNYCNLAHILNRFISSEKTASPPCLLVKHVVESMEWTDHFNCKDSGICRKNNT